MGQECKESFDIYIGDDIDAQLLGVELNGDPVNISAATEIQIDFLNDPENNPPNPIYSAKLSTNEIAISDGPLGKLSLTVPNAATDLFLEQQGFNVDIVVTIAGKVTTYRIVAGANIIRRSA